MDGNVDQRADYVSLTYIRSFLIRDMKHEPAGVRKHVPTGDLCLNDVYW